MISRFQQPLALFTTLCVCFLVTACPGPEVPEQPAEPIYTSAVYEEVDCKKDPKACAIIRGQIAAYRDFVNNYLEPGDVAMPDSISVNGSMVAIAELRQEMTQLRGYDFNLQEVEWIIKQAKKKGTKDVFTMFAINNDPTSVAHRKKIDSPIVYLDLYFQVDTGDNNASFFTAKEGLAMDDYGDFPLPCPRICPN